MAGSDVNKLQQIKKTPEGRRRLQYGAWLSGAIISSPQTGSAALPTKTLWGQGRDNDLWSTTMLAADSTTLHAPALWWWGGGGGEENGG